MTDASRPRVTLVTGSGSGIGAATCRALAGPGQAFIVHARASIDKANAVAAELKAAGADAEVVMGDMRDPETVTALLDTAKSRFGGLDALIHCAGFAISKPFGSVSDEDFERSFQSITLSFARLVNASLSLWEQARDGRIVAISSFVAHTLRQDVPVFPASAAAKAGLEAQVRILALQLAPLGVTVNAVSPGFIQKDRGSEAALTPERFAQMAASIPMARLGLPAEVGAVAGFLASPAASYITGQVIHVNGGLV